MNIPERITDVRQGTRSESLFPATTAERPPGQASASDGTAKNGTAATDTGKTLSREVVNSLVADMTTKLEDNNVQLKFNVLEENETVQVEILDADGKTVRKIPSDELVKLSKSLKDLDRGFLDQVS